MSVLQKRLTTQIETTIKDLGCVRLNYGKIGRSTKRIDKELLANLNAYFLLQIGINQEQVSLIDCYLRKNYG